MKLFLLLSGLVAISLADDVLRPAYYPFPTTFTNESSASQRIVNGQAAYRNQFPYQISLQRRNILGNWGHICGGSIISKHWILCAAHCTSTFSASNLRVVAGILMLDDKNIPGQQVRNVRQIINHHLYPGGATVSANDISLIELRSPLNFNANVQKIGIPKQGRKSSGNGVLSGWGLTEHRGSTPNHLQYAKLPIVPQNKCKKYLDNVLGRGQTNPFVSELNICSGSHEGHQSACNGDSGGPYVKNGEVIGVVSWGLTPCAGARDAPSVYAKTSAYTNWIVKKTNGEVKP